MGKPTNDQIMRHIMSELIDQPHLKPSLPERIMSKGMVHSDYRRADRKMAPAPSRIDKAFHALLNAGLVEFQSSNYGDLYSLSERVLRACEQGALVTAADLWDGTQEQRSIMKLYGVEAA